MRQRQKAEVDGIVSGRWRFSRRGFLVAKGGVGLDAIH